MDQLTKSPASDRLLAEKVGWKAVEFSGHWAVLSPEELNTAWAEGDNAKWHFMRGNTSEEMAWKWGQYPAYTESVDAALTLPIPEGWWWTLLMYTDTCAAHLVPSAQDAMSGKGRIVYGYCENSDEGPALAICRAWWAWIEDVEK